MWVIMVQVMTAVLRVMRNLIHLKNFKDDANFKGCFNFELLENDSLSFDKFHKNITFCHYFLELHFK